MKRLVTSSLACMLISGVFLPQQAGAQPPEKMSYQAVIRNSSDALVTNKQVGMQISILRYSATGTLVYSETQMPTTNGNGLVSIEIGSGEGFDTIDWTAGPYFIKTETDPTGGTNYTITGTSQLLSVPYALHAKTAESITGTISEADPVFDTSVAAGITVTDTNNWNNKLDSYTETQNFADVIALNDSANAQIKNVTDPTDAQDAATKAYVDALKQQIENLENTLVIGDQIVKDADGNVYNIVKIGIQYWFKENLKTTKLKDNIPIPLVTGDSAWAALTTPGRCYYNNDSLTYKNTYGALYNWYTVNTGKLCPTGWHVPSIYEWEELIAFLGGYDPCAPYYPGDNFCDIITGGGKLKSKGTIEDGTGLWYAPNAKASNESGFTAIPGGLRDFYVGFNRIGNRGYWWSASSLPDSSPYSARALSITSSDEYVHTDYMYDGTLFENGLSVRCLKD